MGQRLPTGDCLTKASSGYMYLPIFGIYRIGSGDGLDADEVKYPIPLYGVITQVHVELTDGNGDPLGPDPDGDGYIRFKLNGTSCPTGTVSGTITGSDTEVTFRCMCLVKPEDEVYISEYVSSGAGQRCARVSLVLWTKESTESILAGGFWTPSSSTTYPSLGWVTLSYGDDRDSVLIPCSIDLSDFYVRLENSPGSGKSYTFTVLKNDVATDISVTISDTDRRGNDAEHSESFVAGDSLKIRCVPSGSPSGQHGCFGIKATHTLDDTFVLSGGAYYGAFTDDEGSVGGPYKMNSNYAFRTSFHETTLKTLRVKLLTAPGVGESVDVVVVKRTGSSDSDTALTLTFDEGETEKTISSDVSISEGDQVYTRRDRSGGYSIQTTYQAGLVCYTPSTGITMTTDKIVAATAYATISVIGDGESCSVRGFCYKEATSGDPNVFDDSYVLDGSDDDGEFATGEYSLTLPLEAGKLYRVRAFAVNDTTLTYGETISAYFEYPSDTMARVSSIRRIYHPGLYRMELALGDLGFEWDVSEVGIKKIPDEVKEAKEPEEPERPGAGVEEVIPGAPWYLQPDVDMFTRVNAILEGWKSGDIPRPNLARYDTRPTPSVPAQVGQLLVEYSPAALIARAISTATKAAVSVYEFFRGLF